MCKIHGLCNGHYVRHYLTIESTIIHITSKWLCIKCFEKLFCQLLSSAADFTWAKHGGGRSKLSDLVLITKTTTRVKLENGLKVFSLNFMEHTELKIVSQRILCQTALTTTTAIHLLSTEELCDI